MKQGMIRVQLYYEFSDDTTNEEIEQELMNVELPANYESSSYEYVGIWNTITRKWEDK